MPLVLFRNEMIQHLVVQFLLDLLLGCQMVAHERLKKIENVKLSVLLVVVVRCSLTRGSNYSYIVKYSFWC